MRTLRYFLFALAISLIFQVFFPAGVRAGLWHTFPQDGRFKRLSSKADMWFYVDDQRWLIRAPDEWQHFMGWYVSQKLLQKRIGKFRAFLITQSAGILTEVSDGYYEGWSLRDLIMDNVGIFSAMVTSEKIKFTGPYDTEKFTVRMHFIF